MLIKFPVTQKFNNKNQLKNQLKPTMKKCWQFILLSFSIIIDVKCPLVSSQQFQSSNDNIRRNPGPINRRNNKITSIQQFSIEEVQGNLIISEVQSLDGKKKEFNHSDVSIYISEPSNQSSHSLSEADRQIKSSTAKIFTSLNDNSFGNQLRDKQSVELEKAIATIREEIGNMLQQDFNTENIQMSNSKQKIAPYSKNSIKQQKSVVGNKKYQQQLYGPVQTLNKAISSYINEQDVNNQYIQLSQQGYNTNEIISSQSPPSFLWPFEQIRYFDLFKFQPLQEKPKRIITYQFVNVGLYHFVPLQYVQNQVYRFYGVVLSLSNNNQKNKTRKQRVNVILMPIQKNQPQYKCTQQNPQNMQFSVSCQMPKPGKYLIAIFVGTYGKYSVRPRSIIISQGLFRPDFQYPQIQDPKNLSLYINNNQLIAKWDSRANLTNLTVYQMQNQTIKIKREYLLSNNHKEFLIPVVDFLDFNLGQTFMEISHAPSADGSLNIIYTKFTQKKASIKFIAYDHGFNFVANNTVMNPQLPWMVKAGEKIKLDLTFQQEIRNIVYIFEPDFKIRRISFLNKQQNKTSDVIKPNTTLTLQMSFNKQGTNILQVNNAGGIATLNRPVYVGQGYPLIPDFKDFVPFYAIRNNQSNKQNFEKFYSKKTLNISLREPDRNSSDEQKIQYALVLLNGLRKKYNVDPVVIDQQLSKIIKMHTDDMVARNYFGHQNPEKQKAKQRAEKAGYDGPVGQNLAQTGYIIQAHLGLQRSPIHLENSINRKWDKVGIGISQRKIGDKDVYIIGYLFSVRDYKKGPLSKQQFESSKGQIVEYIKKKYPSIVKQDKQLSLVLQQWLQSSREATLPQFISSRGYKGVTGKYVTLGYSRFLADDLQNNNILQGFKRFRFFAIGLMLKRNNFQIVQIVLLFG